MTERAFELGLCWGTIDRASFSELVAAAGNAGFPVVTVTPMLYFAEREAGRSDRALRRELANAGVRVSLVDALVRPLPGLPAIETVPLSVRPFFEYTQDDFHRVAEGLHAEALNVAQIMGHPVASEEMVEAVGQISRRAWSHGLTVTLEFASHSAGVHTLQSAVSLVQQVGAANLGVLFDTWHFYRSGGELDDLRGDAVAAIRSVQVCDAPADAKGRPPAPMEDRLLPGDGGIPLVEMLERIVSGRSDLVVAVEVFKEELRNLPPRVVAERAHLATSQVLRQIRTSRLSPG